MKSGDEFPYCGAISLVSSKCNSENHDKYWIEIVKKTPPCQYKTMAEPSCFIELSCFIEYKINLVQVSVWSHIFYLENYSVKNAPAHLCTMIVPERRCFIELHLIIKLVFNNLI